MHGFIFIEFEKFIIEKVGYQEWKRAVAEKNLGTKAFSPTELYPDQKMVELVHAGAAVAKRTPETMLELFGMALVPDLLKVYRAYIDPVWKTLDILEHAEKTIHVAVRKSTSGAAPPILNVNRLNPREVLIEYVSGRNMPELGVGIIKGIAAHFHENLDVKLTKIPEEGRSLILVRLMS